MSAEGEKVINKFGEVMQLLAATDAEAWDDTEVLGFAKGITIINDIMQTVVAQREATRA